MLFLIRIAPPPLLTEVTELSLLSLSYTYRSDRSDRSITLQENELKRPFIIEWTTSSLFCNEYSHMFQLYRSNKKNPFGAFEMAAKILSWDRF